MRASYVRHSSSKCDVIRAGSAHHTRCTRREKCASLSMGYFWSVLYKLKQLPEIVRVIVVQLQDRCSKLTSAPVISEVVGSIPGQIHSSCDVIERATLSVSVGFLRGLRFPPTLHYNGQYWCRASWCSALNSIFVYNKTSVKNLLYHYTGTGPANKPGWYFSITDSDWEPKHVVIKIFIIDFQNVQYLRLSCREGQIEW
jgi:hypothetical protein